MTTHVTAKIEKVSGRAVAVRGDDIDTDRIIPARFLKTITFDGIGAHLFEDERIEATAKGSVHPVDRPEHQGAHILLVNANFGCGSSREHAPQSILRWGIRAIVGESFAEIFAGNSVMIGLPCVSVSKADIARLMTLADENPTLTFEVDLKAGHVVAGELTVPAAMPASARAALQSGDWDATRLLVDRYEQVEAVANRIPYLSWAERA